MFSVSNVLDEKASEVEQSGGASAKLPDHRPPTHGTRRRQVNEVIMFGELSVFYFFIFLIFIFRVCMDVWEWMCE